MEKIEQLAAELYARIKADNPDHWFELVSYLHLLAIQDRFGFPPIGLNPEMRERLEAAAAEIFKRPN